MLSKGDSGIPFSNLEPLAAKLCDFVSKYAPESSSELGHYEEQGFYNAYYVRLFSRPSKELA